MTFKQQNLYLSSELILKFLILKWSIKADSLSGKGVLFDFRMNLLTVSRGRKVKAVLGIFLIKTLNPIHSQDLFSENIIS